MITSLRRPRSDTKSNGMFLTDTSLPTTAFSLADVGNFVFPDSYLMCTNRTDSTNAYQNIDFTMKLMSHTWTADAQKLVNHTFVIMAVASSDMCFCNPDLSIHRLQVAGGKRLTMHSSTWTCFHEGLRMHHLRGAILQPMISTCATSETKKTLQRFIITDNSITWVCGRLYSYWYGLKIYWLVLRFDQKLVRAVISR